MTDEYDKDSFCSFNVKVQPAPTDVPPTDVPQNVVPSASDVPPTDVPSPTKKPFSKKMLIVIIVSCSAAAIIIIIIIALAVRSSATKRKHNLDTLNNEALINQNDDEKYQ